MVHRPPFWCLPYGFPQGYNSFPLRRFLLCACIPCKLLHICSTAWGDKINIAGFWSRSAKVVDRSVTALRFSFYGSSVPSFCFFAFLYVYSNIYSVYTDPIALQSPFCSVCKSNLRVFNTSFNTRHVLQGMSRLGTIGVCTVHSAPLFWLIVTMGTLNW